MKGSSLLAFLGGAVIGGVAALLMAPRTGKETREKIMDFAEDGAMQVKDYVNKNVAKAKNVVDQAREAVSREIDDVKSAICESEKEVEVKARGK